MTKQERTIKDVQRSISIIDKELKKLETRYGLRLFNVKIEAVGKQMKADFQFIDPDGVLPGGTLPN